MMKKIIVLIIALILTSCLSRKKDNINHYLNQKVTQKQLLNNGFYKYAMTYLEGQQTERKINLGKEEPIIEEVYDTITMEVFSNVIPTKRDGILMGPTPIFNNSKKNIKGKIITYFFRNQILEFKSVMSPFGNNHEELFKSKNSIKRYYDSLKIPNQEIPLERLRNHYDSIGLRVKFIVNNYESDFYLSDRNEMITYYLNKKRGNEDKLVWDFYNKNSSYKFVK